MWQVAERDDDAIREGFRAGTKAGAQNEPQHRCPPAMCSYEINSLIDCRMHGD